MYVPRGTCLFPPLDTYHPIFDLVHPARRLPTIPVEEKTVPRETISFWILLCGIGVE